MVEKSPEAFRNISEVSEQLNVPAHVLRFWETRFNQIKPIKRSGGRRYYRPDDIALLQKLEIFSTVKGIPSKGRNRFLRAMYQLQHPAKISPAGKRPLIFLRKPQDDLLICRPDTVFL